MHLTKESEIKNCCVFIFTEKWLHNNISDTAFQLQGLTPICTVTIEALQHQVSTTLTDFVGLFFFFINKDCCVAVPTWVNLCSAQFDSLNDRFCPFCILRKLLWCMSLCATVNDGPSWLLFHCACGFQPCQPENSDSKVLPTCELATRVENTLDLFYTDNGDSHKAIPLPQLG